MHKSGPTETKKFIDALEAWAQTISENEEVQGTHNSKRNKKQYINNIVREAQEMLKVGEWLVGLEITLDNLHEAGCKIDVGMLQHAENALKNIPDHAWLKDLYLLST